MLIFKLPLVYGRIKFDWMLQGQGHLLHAECAHIQTSKLDLKQQFNKQEVQIEQLTI